MVVGLSLVLALETRRAVGADLGGPQRQPRRPGHCADGREPHRPGASACRRRKNGTPKEGPGRSKGGLTTNSHLRANARSLPMGTEITPGQTSDYEGSDMVMADHFPPPGRLIAGMVYDADRIGEKVEAHGAVPVIPMRRNRKTHKLLGTVLYAVRNLVGRCFNRLKHTRRPATRYDKTAAGFLGFVNIACIRLWLRHLSR